MPSAVLDAIPSVEIAAEIPLLPVPVKSLTSPFIVTLQGKVGVKGVLKSPGSMTKIGLPGGKMDIETRLKGALSNFTVSAGFEGGKPGKLAITWSSAHIPMPAMEFALNADITKPFSITFKHSLPRATVPLGYGLEFEGALEPAISFNLTPNPAWPGWARWAKDAVRMGWSKLVDASKAVKFVFVGPMGTVTTVGAAAIGAGAGMAAISAIAYGLYQVGKAHQDGNKMALWLNFADGYAEALADLTSDDPDLTKEEAKPLLDIPWKERMAAIGPTWIKGDRAYIIWNQSNVQDAGKAAILQDVDRFIKKHGREAWNRVKARHIATYGDSEDYRRHCYFMELYSQFKAGKDRIGIRLD